MMVVVTTRKRKDVVQGFTITSKNLEKDDIVLTKLHCESVTPEIKIRIADGYKNRDTRLCEVPLFYDEKQSEFGSVLVQDMYAVKRDNVWIPIYHENR
jgi:hypothetical protein